MEDAQRYYNAIWTTASDPSYDELRIRKAVGFALADLIVDARKEYERHIREQMTKDAEKHGLGY